MNPQAFYDTFPAAVKKIQNTEVFFLYAVKELKLNFNFMNTVNNYLYFIHKETRAILKFPVAFNESFLKYK